MRVLTNLSRNAFQAGADKIKVDAEYGEDGKKVIVRVVDNGPGLPEKAKENMFQPFEGSARKGGTGLGLVIVRDLIEAHGGVIELEKSGPDGAVFKIELPTGSQS